MGTSGSDRADDGTGPAPGDVRLAGADVRIASALAALAALAYGATRQTWLWGDGVGLLNAFLAEKASERVWNHALYLPAARAVALVVRSADPVEPLRWLSVIGGAAGAGASFLLARALGAPRAGALFGASALAASPAAWFFATAVEVHALQLGVIALAALATVLAPWRRPVSALAISCAAFALTYTAHQTSALLGPGWVALVALARRRAVGVAFPREHVLLRVGPALALALAAAIALGHALAGRSPIVGLTTTVAMVRGFSGTLTLRWLVDELLRPQGLLLATALAALISGRARAVAPTLALLVLPFWVFIAGWAASSEGGYFLGTAPFVAVLASFCPLPRSRVVAGALMASVLAAEAWRAWSPVAAREQAVSLDSRVRRAERVREALGERGVLISFDLAQQPVRMQLPRMREWDLAHYLPFYALRGRSPDEFAADMARVVEDQWRWNDGRVAIDVAYRHWRGRTPEFDGYLDAMERMLQERFEIEVRPDPDRGGEWPLLVVLRPRDTAARERAPAPPAREGGTR